MADNGDNDTLGLVGSATLYLTQMFNDTTLWPSLQAVFMRLSSHAALRWGLSNTFMTIQSGLSCPFCIIRHLSRVKLAALKNWQADRKSGQRNFLINLATVCSPRGLSQKLRLRSVKTAVAWSLFFVLKMQGYMGRGSPLLCHKLIKLATFSVDNKNINVQTWVTSWPRDTSWSPICLRTNSWLPQ